MSLSRCVNDNDTVSGVRESRNHECDHNCDSESARALKRILDLLDDLNNQDLRLLDDVIDRLLCIRDRG